LLLVGASWSSAGTITLAWDPNTEPDLAGYKIYYGTSSRQYTVTVDVGNVTRYTIRDLDESRVYYLAVTAYDTAGNESELSDEVSGYPTDQTPPTLVAVASVEENGIDLLFSEPLERTSAENVANYRIEPGLTVLKAELASDGRTVHLQTTAHTNGVTYTVYVSGVTDRANPPNGIASGTSLRYTYVAPDRTPPAVTGVILLDPEHVRLTFSETVDEASATDLANYAIAPSLRILSAHLDDSGAGVVLMTEAHTPGGTYTLTVQGIRDRANPPNQMPGPVEASYTAPHFIQLRFLTSGDYEAMYLREGDPYYLDRDYRVESIPDSLRNALWILTAMRDKDNSDPVFLQFEVDETVSVYVAYDGRVQTFPTWLTSAFVRTSLAIQVSGPADSLTLWRRDFAPGRIALGGNRAEGAEGPRDMYIVLVQPNPNANPEPTENDSPTQPETPSQPIEPAQPTEPQQPTQPQQPQQPAQPTEPGQPQQPAQPTEPHEPGQPAEPQQPQQPSEPQQPAQPTEPGQPQQPAQPTEPHEPGQPSEPQQPQQPSEPQQPAEPTEPGQPQQPAQPTEPHEPGQPAEPQQPQQPSEPQQPAEPTEPGQPQQPAQPTEPHEPGQPAEPQQPQQPSEPQQPAQPTEPGQPQQPAQPTEPHEPQQPSQPQQPAQPQQPNQPSQAVSLRIISTGEFLTGRPTAGNRYYLDRDYVIQSIPDSLRDAQWIFTAMSDKDSRDSLFLVFRVEQDARVYVAYDRRATSFPNWLVSRFTRTRLAIDVSGPADSLIVWRADFPAGVVVLGGNRASGAREPRDMYVVLVKPAPAPVPKPEERELPPPPNPLATGVPSTFQLYQNYPNPFNPTTEIRFDLPEARHVVVAVYNMLGQRVRLLRDADLLPGHYVLNWDARNDNGEPVPGGAYLCRVEAIRYADNQGLEVPISVWSATRKMIYLR
jgi:hypothetical protein